jgi:acetyl esterase/lipase
MLKLSFSEIQHKIRQSIDGLNVKLATLRAYSLGGLALNQLTSNKGYRKKSNIAYGLKARQRLDLYYSDQQGIKPLIVFVHGGAWSRGSKDDYKFLAESLTKAGYDIAIMNYHLAPEHIFPQYIQDLADAIQFLVKNEERLAISTSQIALLGHSAGAFNIMSLIYHPQLMNFSGLDRIKSLIGLAGPYHFDYLGDELAEPAFDTQISYQNVMPYYFVQKNDIKHYLFLAEDDQLVKDKNTFEFQRQLEKVGNHCEVFRIPRTGHVSIMASVATLFSRFYKTRSVILKALEQSFAK